MTLRHLTIFLCVCDEKNMTAAAEKLYIAQPSVSQAIAELEKHYNVRLFERLGRRLYLTVAGQKLLTYARHIVHLNKEAEEAMQEIGDHGVIRVGASVTIGTYVLHKIIGDFLQAQPHVKISSTVNNTKIIEELLLSDGVDIGLVEGMIHAQGFKEIPFMEDELVLVCARSHPFAARTAVELPELHNQEFVVREPGSGTRELFEAILSAQGINWKTVGVHNSAEAIKKAVAAGLGLTVISKMAVQEEAVRKELCIVGINGIHFKRKFNMVYHKNKYISPQLQDFMKKASSFAAKGNL